MHEHRRNILAFALVVISVVALAVDAAAQPPGRGRGGLSRMDANGDGVLQPEEIPARAKPIIGRLAERAGLDPNGPIPLDRLARQPAQEGQAENRDAAQQDERRGSRNDGNQNDDAESGEGDDNRRDDQRRREPGDGEGNDNPRGREDRDERRRPDDDQENQPDRRPNAIPLTVPGFGMGSPLAKVPGFDVPHSVTSQGGPTVRELEAQHDGRLIAYARRLLERADENANQIVDPAEWGRLRWRGDPNEMDTNRDGRLTLAEIIQGIANQRDEDDQPPNRGPDGSPGPVPGGVGPGVPQDSTPPNGDPNHDDKIAEYARNLIRQYDRNNNSLIDGDEREQMRGDPVHSDFNGDGVITEEELLTRLRGPQDSSPPREANDDERQRRREARRAANRARGDADDDRGRGGQRSRGGQPGPAWFRSRDKNGDGQVAMSEYASSWDDAKLAEFKSRDKNGDGVIGLGEAGR